MQVPWKRANFLGNWLDAAQTNDGLTPYASTAVITTVDQLLSVTVTALVQRWMSGGLIRGFYLTGRLTASVWPVLLYGRGDTTTANRPSLLVVTTTGTYNLTAAANATWTISSDYGQVSKNSWGISAGGQLAILRFDLSSVAGTVTSAVLGFKCSGFGSSTHTGQIIDVFEADPPTLILPESVNSPTLGLLASKTAFTQLASDPSVIYSHDLAAGSFVDNGFTPVQTYGTNTDSAGTTTYARGTIPAGGQLSLNSRKDVSVGGPAPHNAPNVVVPELYGQYWLYLEPDFGTTNDDAIKIPAMGVQFGWWNPVGYWQSTTGNGGYPGTGLRVTRADGSYEYQGHSIRILTGTLPALGDDDPYTGYFALGFYPYNLDQPGPFPPGETWPNLVIRTGAWYCIDLHVKQNSMAGGPDADGNYATANADGVLQAWINGYPAYSKTNFRWRRHADFGVQGIWLDVYHGGQTLAPSTMHYRIDRVSLATSYIGPKS